MSTFYGEVSGPGASGPIVVSLPKSSEGWVSGSLKIGADLDMALSGFSGKMTGPSTFAAAGRNQRGRGLEVMYLDVQVKGELTPDGEHVRGQVVATINNIPQQLWTFSARVRGAAPLEPLQDQRGELELETVESEEGGYLSSLKIPTPLKWVAGVGAAVAAAFYAKKRFM